MRKLLTIILLFTYSAALLTPALLQNCKPLIHILTCLRRNIRSEQTELFTIVITKATYAKLKQGHDEIWWQGNLLDIHHKTEKNGLIELLVEPDHYETQCLNNYTAINNFLTKHTFPKIPAPPSGNGYRKSIPAMKKIFLHSQSSHHTQIPK